MEKLYALSTRTEDPPDLIVLDTPPATNAVEFLEAPSRMLNALDNDATRWFLEPYAARGGKVANRLIDAGSSFFVKTIGRFTGTEAIQELAELLTYFQGMFEGFRQRAQAVETILSDERTSFFVITKPRPGPMDSARSFVRRLKQDEIAVQAFILNRATVNPLENVVVSQEALAEAVVAAGGTEDLAARLASEAHSAAVAAEKERGFLTELEALAPGAAVVVVPELSDDVHDLAALDELRSWIFRAGDRVSLAPGPFLTNG